jgi:hypothetical protein
MPQVIQSLTSGPIDIIGDVHGELEALISLIKHLGYNEDGMHPEKRMLVFLGDLIDRGPFSPSVAEFVMKLHRYNRAYCLLGNHELRILSNVEKAENAWISQQRANYAKENGWMAPMEVASETQAQRIIEYFNHLPLGLERPDLKLVHACWHNLSFEQIPHYVTSWSQLNYQFQNQINETLKKIGFDPLTMKALYQEQGLNLSLEQRKSPPRHLPILARYYCLNQNLNPLRVITQGLQGDIYPQKPFWSGFQWQITDRQKWWEFYDQPQAVVFGHYWRSFNGLPIDEFKPQLFAPFESQPWIGQRKRAFCLDFAVGQRFQTRLKGEKDEKGFLAALRVPAMGSREKWQLVLENGNEYALQPPQLGYQF